LPASQLRSSGVDGVHEPIRFDDVVVDPAAMTVSVGGVHAHVEPQVFDVLVYLARHRDRVVTKNELLDNIWGDRFVSESALTSRIKDARRIVGDDGRSQRVIRTVHGRGYQFVADVLECESTAAQVTLRAPAGREAFVGRKQEIRALFDAVAAHQLVTVVGPGGVGKTRLATELARIWEDDGRPVHVVELASVTSPMLVGQQICDALGVRSQGEVDLIPLAAQELRGSARLLVLDNFEHVADAAVDVDRLRELVPDLRVCVTSREPLRISGEQVIRLHPLDTSPDLGREAPAIVLFETLAQRLDQSFAVDDSNAELVREICILVDGLPLGLDLAAAQLRHMPIDYLRIHLQRDAAAIGHDLRDRPERQRTVNDLIGWSNNLLAPSAQRLLARLSVFRGGIPLSGLRAVGEFDSATDALRGIAELVDKSLVVAERVGAEPRYDLLNLIRSFAGERLAAPPGGAALARKLHARWVADLVREIEADRWDRNVGGWIDDLSREYPNMSVALEHLLEEGDRLTIGRIMADTNMWWYRVGRHDEARRWVGAALAAGEGPDQRSLGRLHLLAGLLEFAARNMEPAMEHYRKAIHFAERSDDWRYEQIATSNLAIRALRSPDELPDGIAELEGVVDRATERDEPAVLAHALNTLGVVLHRSGRDRDAIAQHELALEVNRRIGDRLHEALNYANLGHIELEAGRPDTALVSSKSALTLASRIGDSLLAAWVLAEIASAEQMRGNPEEAATLLGASEAYTDAIGAHRGPAAHQAWHDITVQRLRDDLGDTEFELHCAAGAAMPLKDVIERALTP
jgi:predicted ATPase/DNA-binding winged helix-turn-helix (wHTH) protein